MLLSVLFYVIQSAFVAIPGVDIQMHERYMAVARQFAWKPTIDIQKAEKENPNLEQSEDWLKFKEMASIAGSEVNEVYATFSEDIKAAESNSEMERIVRNYILESRKVGKKFFQQTDELMDPVQRFDIIRIGLNQTSSWIYDPWLNDSIGVSEEKAVKIEKLLAAALNTAFAKVTERSKKDLPIPEEIVLRNLDRIGVITQYLKILSREQRALVLSFITGVPEGSSKNVFERALIKTAAGSLKTPSERERFEASIHEMVSVLDE